MKFYAIQNQNLYSPFFSYMSVLGNDLFLMFAYLYGDRNGANSDVFKWKAGEFKKDHTIPVIGTDVDAFTVEGKHFAAVVGKLLLLFLLFLLLLLLMICFLNFYTNHLYKTNPELLIWSQALCYLILKCIEGKCIYFLTF